MSPHGLAKAECANYNGGCCVMRDTAADPSCMIARGQRCGYFERCILPLADDPSPTDDPKLQARRIEARAAYLADHPVGRFTSHGRRLCPECGRPIGERRRICDICRRDHRREADRRQKRREREALSYS